MRSRLVPFPSPVPPVSIPIGQGLISSSFPPVSSLLHRPSSLGVPLSSLLLSRKRPMALATFSPASPESLFGPRPWFSGFPGFLGFAQFLHCFSLHCIGWQCSASHLHVYCFVLHIALLTLLCIALMCTALHRLAFALRTFACNALRCIELASGFHDNAMHCTAIVLTPFLSVRSELVNGHRIDGDQ